MTKLQEIRRQLEEMEQAEKLAIRQELMDVINNESEGKVTALPAQFSASLVYIYTDVNEKAIATIMTLKQWEDLKAFAQAWNTPSNAEMEEMESSFQDAKVIGDLYK
jgi:flagellar motility protein MotE (MotC chaperone)